MTPCERLETKILALHLNELDALTSWRVRRHIRTCPTCAARLAAESALDARLRRAALVRRPAPIATRTARRTAVRVGGLALAAVGCIGGAIFLRPGTPGGPSVAFGKIERAFQESNFVAWQTTFYDIDKKTQKKVVRFRTKNWYRSKPSTLYTEFEEYWKVRKEILPIDPASRITWKSDYDWYERNPPLWGNYSSYWHNSFNSRNQPINFPIKNLVMPPPYKRPIDVKPEDAPDSYFGTPWRIHESFLNGAKVVLFENAASMGKNSSRRNIAMKVFVDPQSSRIIQQEHSWESKGSPGSITLAISEGYQYLPSAPSHIFDIPRPKLGEIYEFVTATGKHVPLKAVQTKSIQSQVVQMAKRIYERDAEGFSSMFPDQRTFMIVPERQFGLNREDSAKRGLEANRRVISKGILRDWKPDPIPMNVTSQVTAFHKMERGSKYPPSEPRDAILDVHGSALMKDGKRRRVRCQISFRLSPKGPIPYSFLPDYPR